MIINSKLNIFDFLEIFFNVEFEIFSGPSSNSTENSSITISDCDSPSVLSSISKSAKRKRNHMNFNDDDDDFKTPLITSCDEPKRKKRPGIQSTSSKVKPATNSYGMTVTVATESQVPRMKQSSIKDILVAANKVRTILEFYDRGFTFQKNKNHHSSTCPKDKT